MQRIIFLFALIGLSLFAHADLQQKIERVNKTVKSVGEVQPECKNCNFAAGTPSADATKLMQSCVESICPDANFSLAKIYHDMVDRAGGPDAQFDKELAPLIESLNTETAASKLAGYNKALEWIKAPRMLKDPGAIRVFNLFAAIGDFSKWAFKLEAGRPVIDEKKSREKFPKLSEADFKNKVALATKILTKFSNRPIPETDPARVQLFYPGDKFKERVNEVLNSFITQKAIIDADPELKFLSNLGQFKELASGEKLRAQFAASQQINPALIDELNQAYSTMAVFTALSLDSEMKKMLESAPVDIKKFATEHELEQNLRTRIAIQRDLLDSNNKSVSRTCRVAFALGQNSLPTQQQLDAFRKKADAVKRRFLQKTTAILCPEMAQKYTAEVNSWIASLPLSHDQHLANMKAALSRGIEKRRSEKESEAQIEKSADLDIYYAIGFANLGDESDVLLSASDELCQTLIPNILPDATVASSDVFVAGPVVIEHENAEGIADHEMGHKLFNVMSNKNTCTDKSNFEKIRACLIENHTELSEDELKTERLKMNSIFGPKYESEDWADLISSVVDEKENNIACLFTRKVKPEDYATLSMKNSADSDPHSADLFRLLHLNFLKKGSLPEQCNQALAAKGEKANFKNCLN